MKESRRARRRPARRRAEQRPCAWAVVFWWSLRLCGNYSTGASDQRNLPRTKHSQNASDEPQESLSDVQSDLQIRATGFWGDCGDLCGSHPQPQNITSSMETDPMNMARDSLTDAGATLSERQEPDLGTAAFLQVRGFRLLGLAPLGGGRWAFRFADPDGKASQAALAYLQGESVPARALIAAEKDLKTLLYSQKGNGNGNSRYSARR